jgi:adenosylcobinamide-phosphate synthase
MLGVGAAAWSLPLGAALDVLLGDPRGWPHPVRAIGRMIEIGEGAVRWRRAGAGPTMLRLAGVALATIVVGTTALAAWSMLALAERIGQPASWLASGLLIYWGLAARGLSDETKSAADAPDLPSGRRALSRIVGRDTADLDWPEIHRACLETIGENANDGVVAPLFWYAVGGPVALWAYKAINTLDSMVGHRDERYRDFGWASARLDDLVNLLPARLTWLLFALAALVLGERALGAARIGWRDGRKHPSPNSAWGEAALAGALGVQLGGAASYESVPCSRPHLGDRWVPVDRHAVRRGIRLMWGVTIIALALAWCGRMAMIRLA